MNSMKKLFVLFSTVLFGFAMQAAEIKVGAGETYTTIQAAINAATAGDTIIVAAGTYTESVYVGKSLEIIGAGAAATIVDGNAADSVLSVIGDIDVAVSGLTLKNGSAEWGGGVYASIIVDILTLSLTDCVIKNNKATVYGGGGLAAVGGAEAITMTGCTLSGNSAAQFNGGGVYMNSGILKMENCTVSDNMAKNGGGFQLLGTEVALDHLTVVGNQAVGVATSKGGGLSLLAVSGTVNNSIICGNTDQSAGTTTDNINGVLPGGSNNLVDQDAKLGPLADNGGPTPTHKLLVDSPAINAGAVSTAGFDQRGVPRPQGGAADIGAFETIADVYVDQAYSAGSCVGHLWGYDAFATIQGAVNGVSAGVTINVAAGTYNENVNLNKAVTLVSLAGKDSTIITGSSAQSTAAGGSNTGTLCVSSPDVKIGTTADNGFTINGYDTTYPAVEHAAIYLQPGASSGCTVIGNNIVANGEAGLLGQYGTPANGIEVAFNVFSGKTYVGETVGGNSSVQNTTHNVPRSMVFFGGNTSGIYFHDNVVGGSVGAIIEGTSTWYENTGATIDCGAATNLASGARIENNTFTTPSWAGLRARGSYSTISGNTFDMTVSGTDRFVGVAFGATANDVYTDNTFAVGPGLDAIACSGLPGATVAFNVTSNGFTYGQNMAGYLEVYFDGGRMLTKDVTTLHFTDIDLDVTTLLASATMYRDVPAAYATIQAAVDACNPGDVVRVANGTHVIDPTLKITTSISIVGASREGVIINASTRTGSAYGIEVTANNVTLEHFTLLPANHQNAGFPIHLSNTPNVLENITLRDIEIAGSFRTPFDCNGVNNLTLDGLIAKNAQWGSGVGLSGCINVTITGCTTLGNAWGGVRVSGSTDVEPNRFSSAVAVNFANNTFGEPNALYVEDATSTVDATNYSYRIETVVGMAYLEEGVTEDAQAIAFALQGQALTGVTVTGIYPFAGDPVAFTGDTSTAVVYVDKTWTGTPAGFGVQKPGATGTYVLFGRNAFATVQSGVDGVDVGGTVNVAAGTYSEEVQVTKKLNLLGAQAGVDPRVDDRKAGLVPESIIDGSINESTQRQHGLFVKGVDGAHVSGLVVDGFEIRNASYANIRFDYVSTSEFKNLMVHGCTGNEGIKTKASCASLTFTQVTSYNNAGDGIELGGYGTQSGHLIQKSEFFNNGDRGIYLDEVSDTTVCLSKVYGNLGTTGNWHTGGIITYKSSGTQLVDNEVYENVGSGIHLYKENEALNGGTTSLVSGGLSYGNLNGPFVANKGNTTPGDGIRLYLANNVTVTNVTSYGNARNGISIGTVGEWKDYGATVTCNNNTVSDCNVYENTVAGIGQEGQGDVGPRANTFTGNTLFQNTAEGVALLGGAAAINNNAINGNAVGVRVSANSAVLSLAGNAFTAGTLYIDNQSTQDFDLTDNGTTFDETDPFAIEALVYHKLDDAALGLLRWAANAFYVTPGNSIQRAIDVASAGETIYLAAGAYDENPVLNGKQLNFVGQTNVDGAPLPYLTGALDIVMPGADNGWCISNINFIVRSPAVKAALTLKSVNGLTIGNCTFDGASQFLTGKNGINFTGGGDGNTNVMIQDCLFTNGLYVAVNGYASGLTVKDSALLDTKSGINIQGGGNLVVENSDISVIAQGTDNDTYGIRFASDSGSTANLTVTGGSIMVDHNTMVASAGTYHAAIIVRKGATGDLSLSGMQLYGEVVNNSTHTLGVSNNFWGTAFGPSGLGFFGTGSAVAGSVNIANYYIDPLLTTLHYYDLYVDGRFTTEQLNVNHFQEIHAAYAAANPGDTIHVANGSYDLPNTLAVNKPGLTIIGESRDNVLIDASARTGTAYGIKVSANDVTLEKFTLTPASHDGAGFPIHLSNTPNVLANITLRDIKVAGSFRTPFDCNGVDNLTLADLVADGTVYGSGIGLTGCRNVLVAGCTTTGNAWGGVRVGASPANQANRPSSDINVDFANNTFNEVQALYVEDALSTANVTNYSYRVLTNAGSTSYFEEGRVEEQVIAFALQLEVHYPGLIVSGIYEGNGDIVAFTGNTSTAVVYVDKSWEGFPAGTGVPQPEAGGTYLLFGRNAFATIQEGINAVNAAGTLHVAAGTYVEQVVINKDVNVVGSGNPVVKAPAAMNIYTFTEGKTTKWEPIIFAFGGDLDDKDITGAGQVNVAISGITVDGNGRAKSNRAVGILYRNVTGGVDGSTVQNMGYLDGIESYGVLAYGTSDVVFSNNSVSGYSSGGFMANGVMADATMPKPNAIIEGNTVTGLPFDAITTKFAANGIQVGWGATGIVRNNIVTQSDYATDKWAGSGILVQSSTGVVVEGNTATGNTYGICVAGYVHFGGTYADNTIITNNIVSGNTRGINITNRSKNTSVANNTVSENDYGVYVTFSGTNLPPEGTVIAGNLISNNTTAGLYSKANVLTVDASANYWGTEYGPSGTGFFGTGDAIVGAVDIASYYTDSPLATLHYYDLYVDLSFGSEQLDVNHFNTIQAAYAAANPGDTIHIANGEYTLSPTFTVAKQGLTITGESRAGVIIDASARTGTAYGILVSANDVTLEGFTLTPAGHANAGFPIHLSNTPNILVNITLRDITITGAYRTPFDCNGVDNLTLDGLVANGTVYGSGIGLTGCSNVLIAGCTTTGNAWGGVRAGASPASQADRPSSDINVDFANNTFNEVQALYVEDTDSSVTATNYSYRLVTNAGITTYLEKGYTEAQAIALALQSEVTFTGLKVTGLYDANDNQVTFAGDTSTAVVYVSENWATTQSGAGVAKPGAPGTYLQFGRNAFASITNGVSGVDANGTVHVAAGSYAEHVTIAKALNLTGAGRATTTISGDNTGVVVQIAANNVAVSGFTVTGAALTDAGAGIGLVNVTGCFVTNCAANANGVGIAAVGSSANTISGNMLANNGVSIGLDNMHAVGGDVESGATGNTIANNTVSDSQTGIYVAKNCDNNFVTNNTVTASAASGIYLWNADSCQVLNNSISGTGTNGIEMATTKNSTVTGNTVGGVQNGIVVRSVIDYSQNNVFAGNILSGCSFA
ncbi:MAG: right-handed parallel beta-helix repeat-containing protein, partial [Kiritimatiellae bacterium]|nr:right-handed parallel beta-helix repeat-containing protein [Kiritimatiellia bacterium]